MPLTTLDILYITLSIFIWIIWTLLAIVLFKVIKILWPIEEIASYYNTIKKYLSAYKQIPEIIKIQIFEYVNKIRNKRKNSKK